MSGMLQQRKIDLKYVLLRCNDLFKSTEIKCLQDKFIALSKHEKPEVSNILRMLCQIMVRFLILQKKRSFFLQKGTYGVMLVRQI